jgi:hypothetical protein
MATWNFFSLKCGVFFGPFVFHKKSLEYALELKESLISTYSWIFFLILVGTCDLRSLLLTLGSPLKKDGREKKTRVINHGQHHLNAEAKKGREKKNLVINPGQTVGKGQEKKTPGQRHLNAEARKGRVKQKKTMLLTLGSPSEKVEKKKKTLVLTLGSPPEKGGREKKNPCINPGQRHLNAKAGSAIELSRHRQTDGLMQLIK